MFQNRILKAGARATPIPSSVTSIGECAFCASGLQKAVIPDSVTEISRSVFASCYDLKEITIPSTVTSIGECVFFRCYDLEEIVIPGSVTSIHDRAFEDSGLKKASLPCRFMTEVSSQDFFSARGVDFSFSHPNRGTCVQEGYCDCGEYSGFDYTRHEETELRNAAEATCTETGYTGDVCCKDCGFVFTAGEAIEAKGHVGGTATCVEKAACEVCGEQYGELDAENHGDTELRNAAEATCTETGYTGDTCCKDCGFVFAAGETVAAKGHAYTSAVTKEPTIKEDGVLTYTCVNCNDTYTEVIEKLPDPAKGVVAEVTYATHWGNGGQVEITLTNGGEDFIGGWSIELDLNISGELTNSWGDGYVTSFENGHVMITNQSWVQDFMAGTTKKIYLQYNGTPPGFVTCTQNGDALVAKINYLNHWGNGGQIEILLENTGAVLNNGWGTELTINLTGKMAGTWGDGFVTFYENGHIVIKNQDWVKSFESGIKKSVWLQFDGILPVEASNVVAK